jgi:hypothetical protein
VGVRKKKLNAKKETSDAASAGSNPQRVAESITGRRYNRAITWVESCDRASERTAVVRATAPSVSRKSIG